MRRWSFAISTVFVFLFVFIFVGLHEPCTTLALWLDWMQRFLHDVKSGLSHSVIKSKERGGVVILNTAPLQQDDEHLLNLRELLIWKTRRQSFAVCVRLCGIA